MAKKAFKTATSSTKLRGRVVESIVAAMHVAPGVKVQQNIRLPPLTGGGRSREIDILIDGSVAGYPIRVPIECKNEKSVVGAEQIDAFVGKLQYLGLSPRQAVYVSVSGYTKGALARAREAGIRTFVLTGLTPERLGAAILEAVHAIVYLWPVVTEWSVSNNIGRDIAKPEELAIYHDEAGNNVGSIADLVWQAWIDGVVPDSVGVHEIDLALPNGWSNVVAGEMSKPDRVRVILQVFGIAVSFRGTATRNDLIDAETRVLGRLRLRTHFDAQAAATPQVFSTEESLIASLDHNAPVQLSHRIRLPRIEWKGAFWPLSVRVAAALDEHYRLHIEREPGIEPPYPDLTKIERPSFEAMWEPLWLGPYLKAAVNTRNEGAA